MKKYFFIVNPNSGKKRSSKVIATIESHMSTIKSDYEVLVTESAGHATQLVEERIGIEDSVFVAVGGDGSINEIGKALVNQPTVMGIIPVGSGNGLARHLNISLDVVQALKTLTNGVKINMDVGKLNGRYFFVTSGVGFDADVALNFSKRKTRGLVGYAKETLKLFPLYSPLDYRITVNGKSITKKAFSITVANSSQYGNDAIIASKASVVDGKLDLCIIKSYPKLFGPQLGLSLFMNNLHDSRFYRSVQSELIEIDSEQDAKEVIVHIDGESSILNYPIRIEVVKKALNIIVPQERKI